MTFGEKIKELRNALGISQRKLANDLHITETTIQRYETKNYLPDREVLIMLANYFCVSTDYLLGVNGLKQQIEERKNILSEERLKYYKSLVRCKNQNKVEDGEKYYWIFKDKEKYGGHTIWNGFVDDNCMYEKRELRIFSSNEVVSMCSTVYGKPLIINSAEDVESFTIFGGQAIIKLDICNRYLPEYTIPFIEKTNLVKIK